MPEKCELCGRPKATADDWKNIPEGQGPEICWRTVGDPANCCTEAEAVERLNGDVARLEDQLDLANTVTASLYADNKNLTAERDRLLQDIESGFMVGSYARLKELQRGEAEKYRLRDYVRELEKWCRETQDNCSVFSDPPLEVGK